MTRYQATINKLPWYRRFLVVFGVFSGFKHIGSKHWDYAYHYGVDKRLFFEKQFCKCKHRWYSHTNYQTVYKATLPYTAHGCSKEGCDCANLEPMDNLDWIEYSDGALHTIQKFVEEDLFDYFRVIELGARKL